MSKSSKRRVCPAVQREITATECGENRVSRYQCPEECPFNPFDAGSYDTFTEIEAGVIRKSLEWFLECSPNRPETVRQLDRLVGKEPMERHAYQVSEVFYKRNAKGQTVAEFWAASGYPGLKNDERVIQRAVTQMRVRLLEVHRVFDDLRIEAVDLLEAEPKPFLICDRALAARACRFTTLLGWYFPLPHFWRSFGFGLSLSAIGSFEPQEVVMEIVRHLGGPAERENLTEWFGANCARFAVALNAVSLARREQMFAGIDAEFGKVVYELRAPFADCRDALDVLAAVAHDELAEGEQNEGFAEARVWFDETPGPVAAGETARPVLGRVLLGQAHWRLEAMGTEKVARLRKEFEEAFGERVRFSGERRDNLLTHLKSKEPKYDGALVPPRLLGQPSKISITSNRVPTSAALGSRADIESNFHVEQDRAWLGNEIPALDGKTPREAARDSVLRPALIRLLKERVRDYDERNLKTGGSTDINWLLKELGTQEIIFDPPPVRTPTHPETGEDFEYDEEHDEEDDLKRWPALPPRPFTREEAVEQLLVSFREFATMEEAEDAMSEAGGFLIEDVRDVVGDMLSEEEHDFLEPYLVQTWFAFVPPVCFGPLIEPEEIHEEFGRKLQALVKETEKSGSERSGHLILEHGAQPAMVQALAVRLLDQWDKSPVARKWPKENRTLMMIILRTVIDLLDAKCRTDEL